MEINFQTRAGAGAGAGARTGPANLETSRRPDGGKQKLTKIPTGERQRQRPANESELGGRRRLCGRWAIATGDAAGVSADVAVEVAEDAAVRNSVEAVGHAGGRASSGKRRLREKPGMAVESSGLRWLSG